MIWATLLSRSHFQVRKQITAIQNWNEIVLNCTQLILGRGDTILTRVIEGYKGAI